MRTRDRIVTIFHRHQRFIINNTKSILWNFFWFSSHFLVIYSLFRRNFRPVSRLLAVVTPDGSEDRPNFVNDRRFAVAEVVASGLRLFTSCKIIICDILSCEWFDMLHFLSYPKKKDIGNTQVYEGNKEKRCEKFRSRILTQRLENTKT